MIQKPQLTPEIFPAWPLYDARNVTSFNREEISTDYDDLKAPPAEITFRDLGMDDREEDVYVK